MINRLRVVKKMRLDSVEFLEGVFFVFGVLVFLVGLVLMFFVSL